jgi:hypothetical protein
VGRPNKLRGLAAARGKSEEWYLEFVVVPTVNKHGQDGAAGEFGVSQSTVSSWLKDKYVLRPMWMKKATPEEVRRIDQLVTQVKQEKQTS